MSDDRSMSKVFAAIHREWFGVSAREHLALLLSAGVDQKTCAFLLGVTESRISSMVNPETAAKDRERKKLWMREYRKRKKVEGK